MPICPNCGIEYEEGKKFCRECGSPLVPSAAPSPPPEPVPVPPSLLPAACICTPANTAAPTARALGSGTCGDLAHRSGRRGPGQVSLDQLHVGTVSANDTSSHCDSSVYPNAGIWLYGESP